MELVLGIYTIKPGELDDWVEARTGSRPNAAYYDSPERAALNHDPARHIAEARQLAVRALDLA